MLQNNFEKSILLLALTVPLTVIRNYLILAVKSPFFAVASWKYAGLISVGNVDENLLI